MSQVQSLSLVKITNSARTVAPGLGALLGHAGHGNWLGPLVDPRQSVELVPKDTGTLFCFCAEAFSFRGCTGWCGFPRPVGGEPASEGRRYRCDLR